MLSTVLRDSLDRIVETETGSYKMASGVPSIMKNHSNSRYSNSNNNTPTKNNNNNNNKDNNPNTTTTTTNNNDIINIDVSQLSLGPTTSPPPSLLAKLDLKPKKKFDPMATI